MNQDNKIGEKEASSDLSRQEQEVLKDLESEGVEISTDVTKVLESLTEEQRKVIVGALAYSGGYPFSISGDIRSVPS